MRKSILALACAVACLVPGTLSAQQATNPATPPTNPPASADRADVDVQAGQNGVQVDVNDRRMRAVGQSHRVSDITGMDVKNMQGEELGEVNDLVIDLQSGRVRYAALSVGGILGIGDKMFAIPWSAFEVKGTGDDMYLVLNASEASFENAPGFDQDHWPNFADQKWTDTNDQYYKQQGVVRQRADNDRPRLRDRLNNRERDIDVDVDTNNRNDR